MMKILLVSIVVSCVGFASGWYACEWTEQAVHEVMTHHTVIPQPVQQVP